MEKCTLHRSFMGIFRLHNQTDSLILLNAIPSSHSVRSICTVNHHSKLSKPGIDLMIMVEEPKQLPAVASLTFKGNTTEANRLLL